MKSNEFISITNGTCLPVKTIPVLSVENFNQVILAGVGKGQRVVTYFGNPTNTGKSITLFVVLADDEQNKLYAGRTEIQGPSFTSLTPQCPQVHLFEREIAEQFGLKALGHPWFKPVRYCRSGTEMDAWERDASEPLLPAIGDFYRVEGEQVHEVAVGPVHAGIIEPGHFRFQCHGELVMHLEIALGFQHRGIEEAMVNGPTPRSVHYMETAAGDTTIGHTTTYCQIMESLLHIQKTARAQVLRGIALELERLANHVGDLGALSGDVGFLPTASFCGRIRGEFLNLTALLCGNRFGRGYVRFGGVSFDIEEKDIAKMLSIISILKKQTEEAVGLLWDNQSVMARFEDTGRLTKEQAIELGLVGPVARACGLLRDVRYTQPSGIYRFAQIPVSTYDSGDVFARAYVRWMEIGQSISFIEDRLKTLPKGSVINDTEENPDEGNQKNAESRPAVESFSVAVNEGWRGEICHTAITDKKGLINRYKIVDPSFHNWYGLAEAVRNQEISDFPLCNKSFSLSYCGHDL